MQITEKLRNLCSWLKSCDEESPKQKEGSSFSWFLCLVGCVFFLLRRLSLIEYIKHFLWIPFPRNKKQSGRVVPARFVDTYIAIWLIIILVAVFLADFIYWLGSIYKWGAFSLAIFIAIQILQANVYNFFWRIVVGGPMSPKPHNPVRNAFITIIAYFEISLLFGLTYYWGFRDLLFQCKDDGTVIDAIYFSITTAMTLGPAKVTEEVARGQYGMMCVICIQLFASLMMIATVLARAVSVVEEYKVKEARPPAVRSMAARRVGGRRRQRKTGERH